MSANLAQQAELAAARVDAADVGLDPITIIMILTEVLPLLASCWNRHYESDPQKSADQLRWYHEKHPGVLRRRMAKQIRMKSKTRITEAQSIEMAIAVIDQALSLTPETAAMCCTEAGL